MKNKIIITVILIFLMVSVFAVVAYVWRGAHKSLTSEIQWVRDNNTEEVVPIFSVHYSWNKQKEHDPTWMIFPKNKKWLVVDLRKPPSDFMGSQNKLLKYAGNFNSEWIETKQFQAKPDRYEIVLMVLGFEHFFGKERTELRGILRGTRNFDRGLLKSDETLQ